MEGPVSDNGRDKRGRFTPGHAGGPGRPKRDTEREYLDALIGAVSLADWREIVLRAVEDAKDGDKDARAFLAKHLIGDPLKISLDANFQVPDQVILYLPHNDREAADAISEAEYRKAVEQ